MSMTDLESLKQKIVHEVFVTKDQQTIVGSNGEENRWLFDFRRIVMQPEVLALLSRIFLEKYKEKYPFQIGCLEVAGVPIMTGLTCGLYQAGQEVNGFFIRKSRKKQGLLNMIEGNLTDDNVILVDDVINSGNSFMRQVEVLESLGKKVDTIFAILRYRDDDYYQRFTVRGIKVESLFTLDDFSKELDVKNLVNKKEPPVPMPFSVDWYSKSPGANFFHVVPKSAPAIDDERIFFGTDSGYFYALDQATGKEVWKYKTYLNANGKYIFSSPTVHNQVVYFGAYDGNFYALDTITGKKKWTFMEADWIGSSPCVSGRHNLVYVGLEFGLFKKKGGIVALDATTGKKIWQDSSPEFTHSSPGYSQEFDIVVCGSNDGVVKGYEAKTGEVLWEYQTEGEVKESFAFSINKKLVLFGSFDTHLYALDCKTGALKFKFKTVFGIYSTPLVYKNFVYLAALDKKVYCVDLDSGELVWEFTTSGRIFASPEVIEEQIYIGSNDGRMYVLDATSGELLGLHQVTERITNKVVYNKKTDRLFLPTFANEIYSLKKKNDC